MIWYKENGNDKDVVMSTRVRLARNLVDYPFPDRLDPDAAKELINRIGAALGDKYARRNMSDTDPMTARSLMEQHMISPEFVSGKGERAFFTSGDGVTTVMACEEDHIRIQAILPGCDPQGALDAALACDDLLDEKLPIAYDEKLGYLTHCPTNLGTGMRLSVMMFLPGLTARRGMGYVTNLLPKFGLTIRGMYGEGTESESALYQISNQITMGISEEDTVKRLSEAVSAIIEQERRARKSLENLENEDQIMRSLGTALYARKMTSEEFGKIWANIRLGISLGIIEMPYEKCDEAFICAQPAMTALRCIAAGKENKPDGRDINRSEYLKSVFG